MPERRCRSELLQALERFQGSPAGILRGNGGEPPMLRFDPEKFTNDELEQLLALLEKGEASADER